MPPKEEYTCVDCGKNHLKINEIVWMGEQPDVDESTVRCLSCHARYIKTTLVGKLPDDVVKKTGDAFEKAGKKKDYNYNRRTVRRAIKK